MPHGFNSAELQTIGEAVRAAYVEAVNKVLPGTLTEAQWEAEHLIRELSALGFEIIKSGRE